MVTEGLLKPVLYFLINTKKYGAGTTVGDFLFQLKSLAADDNFFSSKIIHADDRIIEMECVGCGLIKLSLNSFSAAKNLLNIVTSPSTDNATCTAAWRNPHDLPVGKLLDVPMSEKFCISSHFTAEDIEHASFMDKMINEQFENCQNQSNLFEEDKESVEDCTLDDWELCTVEQIETVSQALTKKQLAIQLEEKAKIEEKSIDHSKSSSLRPDLPAPPLMTVSTFSRALLPTSAISTDTPPPGLSRNLDQQPASKVSSTEKSAKSGISVHKTNSNTHNNSEFRGCDDDLNDEEARDIRRAIAESLKEQGIGNEKTGGTNFNSTDDFDLKTKVSNIIFREGEKRAGIYQAPRGPFHEQSHCTDESLAPPPLVLPEHGSVLSDDAVSREPIVVPQQLKQSVPYRVRFTYDRRNHDQLVQNSFSVLRNGEIDTYYRSDDEDDEEIGIESKAEIA